jgi:hypothetical protein
MRPMKQMLGARVFKSAWFSKAAKKARISDRDLCHAIAQVMRGQADDLGGGVFKRRVNDNMHRSIILARAGQWWIYQYLFAKKDRDNIGDDELEAFRKLTTAYTKLTAAALNQLVQDQELMEICRGNQA